MVQMKTVTGSMTLVLAIATPAYVLQVSDRLTTRNYKYPSGRRVVKAHDAAANKTIVYGAKDALVTIGYSGAAYVQGLATDSWLAQVLDADVSRFEEFGNFRAGARNNVLDMGRSIRAIVTAIDQDFMAMPTSKRASGLVIQVIGWQWKLDKRRFEMPMSYRLSNTGADGATTNIARSQRYWGWERNGWATQVIGDTRFGADKRLFERLSTRTDLLADRVEEIMVDIIREESKRANSTVGPHCMSVLFQLSEPHVRLRFLAGPQHSDVYGFSPWVLMPAGASAPSVITGGEPSLHFGAVEMVLDRIPPLQMHGTLSFGSQPRLPEPP
jgi:hypothetical protein